MTTPRERILQRLYAAPHTASPVALPTQRDAQLYANHPAPHELLARFDAKLVALKGEFFHVADYAAAAAQTRALLAALPPASPQVCLRQAHAAIDALLDAEPWLAQHTTRCAADLANTAFAQYQAGLTVADFLVARTGSIVLNATSAGGRRLSVLPPLHIVLAYAHQIVASLEEALAQAHATTASYMTIITGPSRTSDIEKILVLGAHGPKRLAVIVIDKT